MEPVPKKDSMDVLIDAAFARTLIQHHLKSFALVPLKMLMEAAARTVTQDLGSALQELVPTETPGPQPKAKKRASKEKGDDVKEEMAFIEGKSLKAEKKEEPELVADVSSQVLFGLKMRHLLEKRAETVIELCFLVGIWLLISLSNAKFVYSATLPYMSSLNAQRCLIHLALGKHLAL